MIPSALINLNHNVLSAIDVETTGLLSGYHEIIQIGIVPLDSDLKPSETLKPFYMHIKPEHPERTQRGAGYVHGLKADELANTSVSQDKAADLLDEWFVSLDLPFGKKLAPLAHNWPFEKGFLAHWLGLETYDGLFHPYARDTMCLGVMLNDIAAWHGHDCPFTRLSLGSMCKVFGIVNHNPHDALADALACGELYRQILRSFARK